MIFHTRSRLQGPRPGTLIVMRLSATRPFAMRPFAMLLACLLAALPAAAQTGNAAHDALAARPQAEQRVEFQRMVRETGAACAGVIAIFPAGLDAARTAYWDGRCQDGSLWRVALPAPRLAKPSVLPCGALAPPPPGGPCFQPVRVAATALPSAAVVAEQRGQASCAGQPTALQGVCVGRCLRGGGVEASGAQAGLGGAQAGGPDARYGVIFHTELPLGAFGFANGLTDRLEVNLRAARACQAAAGRAPCRFVAELVNACGALAQAISRHPSALAITSDPSTFIVNRIESGTGATQEAAEAAAMLRCRPFENPGTSCRIAAAGC